MTRDPRLLLAAALLALAAGAALVWRGSGPPAPAPRRPEAPLAREVAPGGAPPDPGAAEVLGEAPTTRRVSAGVLAPPDPGAAPALPPEERQAFADPQEAEDFVDATVSDFLLAVRPDLDLAQVSRSCTDDGRHCAFEGPFLGETFFADWVRAVAAKKTGPDQLRGVRFSTIGPVEGPDGEKRFRLHAHSP